MGILLGFYAHVLVRLDVFSLRISISRFGSIHRRLPPNVVRWHMLHRCGSSIDQRTRVGTKLLRLRMLLHASQSLMPDHHRVRGRVLDKARVPSLRVRNHFVLAQLKMPKLRMQTNSLVRSGPSVHWTMPVDWQSSLHYSDKFMQYLPWMHLHCKHRDVSCDSELQGQMRRWISWNDNGRGMLTEMPGVLCVYDHIRPRRRW